MLGFVPEEEFYRELFSSEIIVDLTENDNCLVCGAYEAMEAGKPLVLSRKEALEEYFTGGTVFTDNDAGAIVQAVREAHRRKEQLRQQAALWSTEARGNIRSRLEVLIERFRTL
jgi:glycosyltransferase involved in cell wall biosynthesis